MNRLRKGAVEIAPPVPMAPATTSAATPLGQKESRSRRLSFSCHANRSAIRRSLRATFSVHVTRASRCSAADIPNSGLCHFHAGVKFRCHVSGGKPTMQGRDIDYRDQAFNLRGYLAWDETATARRPGALVFHEGLGLGEFEIARARMLAELGYVALAADMFGDRRQVRNPEADAWALGLSAV
jgi:hypothetical protein